MSLDRIISAESGGNPYARNPRSSATGAGQFIDSTWLNTIGKYRPDLVQGLDRQQILNLRTDPALSKEMTAAYAKENQGILGAAGLPITDGTTYLAHFAGPQGAIKVLQSDPNAPVGGVLGDAVVRANPFLANMTAGQLAAWADKKMGTPSAPQQPAAQPAASPQPTGTTSGGLLGNAGMVPPQAPQQSTGILPIPESAPPEASALATLQQAMKLMAPKRGLSLSRG